MPPNALTALPSTGLVVVVDEGEYEGKQQCITPNIRAGVTGDIGWD